MKTAPRLQVCGHFQIDQLADSKPIRRLRTRKTEWLCSFLALNRGKWQTRESLIDRFWPQDDPSSARRKLRLALHSVRQALGDALQTEGDKVCLDDIWVDALDQQPDQLRDFELLLGDHDGTLADLVPPLESGWIRELTSRLEKTETADDKLRLALKLSELAPRCQSVAEVLADSRLLVRPGPAGFSSTGFAVSESDRLLASLSLHLLDSREPAAAALIGPPGVGKTHLARRLIPFAKEEEIIPLFVSLREVTDVQALQSLVHRSLLASQGLKPPLKVNDLASTLLILDNADGLGREAEAFLKTLAVEGSPIRLLLTLPDDRYPGLTTFRLRPMSLPRAASSDEIAGSEAARFFCIKAGIDLSQAEPESIYRACHESGGLPLALLHSAKDLLFSGDAGFPGKQGRKSLHHALDDRLRHCYSRLNEDQKHALGFLRLLTPQFHPVLAGRLGLDEELIQQLWERSWIQHSPDGRAFELLPSVISFIEAQNPGSKLPPDWGEKLANLAQDLIKENYLQTPEIFGPSERLLVEALSAPDGIRDEAQDLLFSALYMCRLKRADLAQVGSIGVSIYGDWPNDAWKRERGLNILGSAAFFLQDFPLAERIFRRLKHSADEDLRLIALANAGLIAQAQGHNKEAVALLEASLSASTIKPRQRMARLNNLAHALAGDGRFDEARKAAESALIIAGESDELAEMKSLALVTLGGICLCKGDLDSAQEWADRAVASWGAEGSTLRRLEAVFLSLSICASRSPSKLLKMLEQHITRYEKGVPAAVHYWSQFAAGALVRAGRSEEGLQLLRGRPWPTTPFWLIPLLGPEPEGWMEWDGVSPSNRDRWFLWVNSLKRL